MIISNLRIKPDVYSFEIHLPTVGITIHGLEVIITSSGNKVISIPSKKITEYHNIPVITFDDYQKDKIIRLVLEEVRKYSDGSSKI